MGRRVGPRSKAEEEKRTVGELLKRRARAQTLGSWQDVGVVDRLIGIRSAAILRELYRGKLTARVVLYPGDSGTG